MNTTACKPLAGVLSRWAVCASHTNGFAGSLFDVYPTVLDVLGLELPAADKLAGASVLPLAQKRPMPDRKDYIVVEYHCARPFVSRWHVCLYVPTPRALCVAQPSTPPRARLWCGTATTS